MQVHYDTTNLPALGRAVITIGTFDGVHTGHKEILNEVLERAAAIEGESVLITFHPHPRMVLTNQRTPVQLINTLEERIGLVAEAGIQHLVVVPFTAAFAEQSAEDYIASFLVEKFHPHTIVIGYDHRFGKDRSGSFLLMDKMKEQFGYELIEIPEAVIANNAISSTQIRKAILNGDMEVANKLLGYRYFFSGKVVEGNKMGRTIGYPTANLKIDSHEKLLPHNGVYAVTASIKGNTGILKGMMNIGTRPTISDTQLTIEAHLFNFSENIYGQEMEVRVHAWLRHEQKFHGLPALKEQLANDEAKSRHLLAAF